MVYFDVKPLGDLIKEFYEQHRGAAYVDGVKVIEAWSKVGGAFIASHTIDLSIKNHVLFIRVDSDALRSELSYSKSLLMKNLNEMVGKEMVKEIVLN